MDFWAKFKTAIAASISCLWFINIKTKKNRPSPNSISFSRTLVQEHQSILTKTQRSNFWKLKQVKLMNSRGLWF
jgi:hypothetical protein